MTPEEITLWAVTIAAIVNCLGVVVSTIVGIKNLRVSRHIEHATNSMMTERLAETNIASEARGVLSERNRQEKSGPPHK